MTHSPQHPSNGPDRQPASLVERLQDLVDTGAVDFPQPGQGRTAERLERLAHIAAGDLALARLAEAHLDAVTILREAHREPATGALYGVWASDAPHARLALERRDHDSVVHGSKAFCTGAGLLDRALVTVHHDDSIHLVDIPARPPTIAVDTSPWITSAFADTNTATITVDHHTVDARDLIGPEGWYLDRIGFWHGALAPAACWAGGAVGLVEHCMQLARSGTPDDHLAAHLGVLDSARWELETTLHAAGTEVDAHPADHRHAMHLAYRTRTTVERVVSTVLDHATRAHGPRLLALDPWAARRIGELQLYVRQHHDTRDHAVLGRLALKRRDDDS